MCVVLDLTLSVWQMVAGVDLDKVMRITQHTVEHFTLVSTAQLARPIFSPSTAIRGRCSALQWLVIGHVHLRR